MKYIQTTLLTLIVLIFTTACSVTPKYKITIDAISLPDASPMASSYILKTLDEKKNVNGLLFQQYGAKVAEALQEKGYLQTLAPNRANVHIYFDYGLDKVSEESERYVEPDISFHVGWGYPYYRGFYDPFFYPYYGGAYTSYRRTTSYYNRYITLLAKDPFNKELWRVDVSSIGESKNLKKIIPILIEAAAPYFGTTTAEPVQIVIKDKPKKK